MPIYERDYYICDPTVEDEKQYFDKENTHYEPQYQHELYELKDKLSESDIHAMFQEAVEIERKFICESLPCALLGMNSVLMNQYIQFVADRLLVELGYSRFFNVKNPFDFMEMISLQGKTNFFEKRVSDYSLAKVVNSMNGAANNNEFHVDEDF